MKRNRTKGHSWERKVCLTLRHVFPAIMTSRQGSLLADQRGIDILNTADIAIQCKNYAVKPDFKKELDKIESEDIKILAFKYNRVRGNKGEYAMLYWDDFVKLLEKIYA